MYKDCSNDDMPSLRQHHPKATHLPLQPRSLPPSLRAKTSLRGLSMMQAEASARKRRSAWPPFFSSRSLLPSMQVDDEDARLSTVRVEDAGGKVLAVSSPAPGPPRARTLRHRHSRQSTLCREHRCPRSYALCGRGQTRVSQCWLRLITANDGYSP